MVEADVHSLTVHLAGTFTPTAEMNADAVRASALGDALFDRTRGRMRAHVVPADVTVLLKMCAAVRVLDPELRRRYVTLLLDGLRADGPLPGPSPTEAEVNWRWRQ